MSLKAKVAKLEKFQSTPSARRATLEFNTKIDHTIKFQSTPSARRATRSWKTSRRMLHISIHALREESDGLQLCQHV